MLCYLQIGLLNKLQKMELLLSFDKIDKNCAISESKFNIRYTLKIYKTKTYNWKILKNNFFW